VQGYTARVAEVEGQVVADGDEQRDAEAEARRRLALAQIRQYPDPVLRMRANEVETFDEELARLAERMTSLMHDAHGVGLAATQVGVLRRLFVFTADDVDHALVNPRIVESGGMVETDEEGCLSLGPVRVPVERALEITLEAQDLTGAPVRMELECMAARVVQHELDHLDGVLIVQRTDDASRREALAQLRPQPIIGVG
jgi:peptide deformylase